MPKLRVKSEITLPRRAMREVPKGRDEAIARLHFHFKNEITHTRAVSAMDSFMENPQTTLAEAYYWTINMRDQIVNQENEHERFGIVEKSSG